MEFNELISLQKTRKKPQEGDIFALCPKDGLFCFGKVIKTRVESRDSFINGMNLIYVYDLFSTSMELSQPLEDMNILFAEIVNNQLWLKGFAKNIVNHAVTPEELDKDLAFWDIIRKKYVNLYGDETDHIPEIKGTFGLGSYGSVGRQIRKILEERSVS